MTDAGVTCAACGTPNPGGARFCMSCGAGFEQRCASCGAKVPEGARFCIECGTAVETGPGPPAARPAMETPAEALPEERRQVTVLFADLSGYTAVAERMDPEAVKALVDRSLRRLGQEVERYGGTVDKFIGDNVMALFGAPLAHEDDPERAVRAGLGMQAAMDEINEWLAGPEGSSFLLRVGVNSGEVLAGQVGDRYTVMGDTVNVASRLQAAARPGSVTVGEGTYRATRAAVEYDRLEPMELKGKSEPVPAWEATALLAAAPARRGPVRAETPLIGRKDESDLLESLFERVSREERPHLVTVIGQAGVGKSRLLRELVASLEGHDPEPTIRQGQCPPYGAGIGYWALGEVIRDQFGILGTDDAETAFAKLRSGVEELLEEAEGGEAERAAALIARPLGIELPEGTPPVDEDPQRMRDAIFSAVRACVEALSRRRPLVLAFEDIHWADEGMLDLIEYLARWVRGPLMLISMARDELLERRPGWGGGRRNATTIFLEPLAEGETRELVEALFAEMQNGHADVVPFVATRAGGNPLFAEEMVNRLLEEGTADADTLPETVHSLLAARLDSLRPLERRLLQHAAVVGQTFWEGSLTGIASEEGIDLGRTLVSLQEKDLVVSSQGSSLAGEQEYAFKHVLIRDVAYQMLPKAVRARKHIEVGGFIEERAGERPDAVVALVADHYGRAAGLASEADLPTEQVASVSAKALTYLEAAGDAAAALYSNLEALNHYSSAMELRRGLEEDSRARIGEKQGDVALRLGRVDQAVLVWQQCLDFHRRQEDLPRVGDLHRKIGAGLWHKGEREESIDHYQKGIDLLKDGPPCLELVRLYEEAATLYMHTGDNMLAIYASEKALRLAERLGEAGAASRAHGIFGRVFGRIGDSFKARENLERSVELALESDQAEAVRALLTLGYHLEVSEAEYVSASKAYSEALQMAEEVGDLPSQVELHAALAQLAVYTGDWAEVERSTDASSRLAEREGLTGKLCFPEVMRGILRWREGQWEAADAACRHAHELGEHVGRSEVAFSALFWLAASQRDRGDHPAADTTLALALDICERAGLIAQSIEAMSARAVVLSLDGRVDQGRETADEATRLAERLHYPVGKAATKEAGGATAADPNEGAAALAEARKSWEELGRPLDAARCELLRGGVLRDHDAGESRVALGAAATAYQELGISHQANRALELVAQ
jgi:class 3 adenylate cyclase/tetratricopeptide (TPR) repeat protein